MGWGEFVVEKMDAWVDGKVCRWSAVFVVEMNGWDVEGGGYGWVCGFK